MTRNTQPGVYGRFCMFFDRKVAENNQNCGYNISINQMKQSGWNLFIR